MNLFSETLGKHKGLLSLDTIGSPVSAVTWQKAKQLITRSRFQHVHCLILLKWFVFPIVGTENQEGVER